jgi:hypothetical protein
MGGIFVWASAEYFKSDFRMKAFTFNGKWVYLGTLTAIQKKILAAIGLFPDAFEQHGVSGFSQFLSVS